MTKEEAIEYMIKKTEAIERDQIYSSDTKQNVKPADKIYKEVMGVEIVDEN